MSLSHPEAKQLLERLIFDDTRSRDWVQDVWDLSPMLGDSAAKLLDVFDVLVDRCSAEELEDVLQNFYQERL